MENQNETKFYQDGFVTVTQSRFVTQSKTYAMRNISSVHVFEIIKSKTKAVLMIIFGLLFLFFKDIFWVGFIIIALGIWWLISIKNEYAVRISTNAGEANSIVSKNKDYIQKIVNALNDAIIHRG
ncbi:hypothetical protein BN1195_00047 [Chryseobacterium oranimense G311]|uniref:DUF6232 family protein n=1 Tax=Chryseobacterium oranimense TaxID=421058 RepID=UPI000533768A|nr:DUF6232 family protein [Chryseobacterium oranimense]CEJ67771.1 hypothetical protein BN1195_00047 [Chryseobacterium oranimense G311]